MQILLGLFFFSILLTTGSAMQCVKCLAVNGYCSDVKEECPSGTDTCLTLLLKAGLETPVQVIVKHCSIKEECKKLESLIGKPYLSRLPFIPDEPVVKEVTCSKAPPSFASFFPAFLGLFLMKFLF